MNIPIKMPVFEKKPLTKAVIKYILYIQGYIIL